jgi:hypothetical protein
MRSQYYGYIWEGRPLRQIGPLRPDPQNPQEALKHFAAAAPGPSAPASALGHLTDQGLQRCLLLVRQTHRCLLVWDAAYHPFMR